MLITPKSLDGLFVTYMAHYEMGARSAVPVHPQIADVFSMPVGEFNFPIPEGFPAFRAWPKGKERTWQNLAAHNTKLVTGDYELSVVIPRDAIRYDQYSVFSRDFANAGKRSQLVWDDLAFAALLAGKTAICYDGQEFFDTQHPVRPSDTASAVQSNLHTSRAFNETNLDTTLGEFLAWKGPDGRELGTQPDTLMVGAQNFSQARRITTAEFNAAGASNTFQGTLKVVLIPGLGTSWILASCEQGVKPIAINKAAEATLLPLVAPTDQNVINLREFRYAGDCSGAAALTIPALAHLCEA